MRIVKEIGIVNCLLVVFLLVAPLYPVSNIMAKLESIEHCRQILEAASSKSSLQQAEQCYWKNGVSVEPLKGVIDDTTTPFPKDALKETATSIEVQLMADGIKSAIYLLPLSLFVGFRIFSKLRENWIEEIEKDLTGKRARLSK